MAWRGSKLHPWANTSKHKTYRLPQIWQRHYWTGDAKTKDELELWLSRTGILIWLLLQAASPTNGSLDILPPPPQIIVLEDIYATLLQNGNTWSFSPVTIVTFSSEGRKLFCAGEEGGGNWGGLGFLVWIFLCLCALFCFFLKETQSKLSTDSVLNSTTFSRASLKPVRSSQALLSLYI